MSTMPETRFRSQSQELDRAGASGRSGTPRESPRGGSQRDSPGSRSKKKVTKEGGKKRVIKDSFKNGLSQEVREFRGHVLQKYQVQG